MPWPNEFYWLLKGLPWLNEFYWLLKGSNKYLLSWILLALSWDKSDTMWLGVHSCYDGADRAKCVLPHFCSIGCVAPHFSFWIFQNDFEKFKILKPKYFEKFKILNFSKYFEDRQTDRSTNRPTGPTYIGHLPWPKKYTLYLVALPLFCSFHRI